MQPDAALASLSTAPTTPPHTQAGIVLGTMGYMSPEQVRGIPADHRADLFAFGVVLYEMLSGQRAFQRDTGFETMTAILKEDPGDLPIGERQIPPALARIVDRCLEKSPAARFQSAADLGFALEALSSHSDSSAARAIAVGAPATRVRAIVPWIAAAASLLTAAVLAFLHFGTASQPAAVVRFQIAPPRGGIFPGANNTPRMSVSPDGQYVAFSANLCDGKPDQFFIRRLDSLDARAVADSAFESNAGEAVQQPFWSPDSRSVAYFVDGKLRKVEVTTGAAQTLATLPGNNYGGTWNRDGVILLGTSQTKGLRRVSAEGGELAAVTSIDESSGERAHLWPQFLSDGRHFLYMVVGDSEEREIYAGSLDSGGRQLVLRSTFMPQFAAPDHLFFVRDGALWVQQFDVDTLALQGSAVQVADSVQASGNGRVGMSVSDTGVLVFRAGTGTGAADSQLVWFDRGGKQLGTLGAPAVYRGVELSPDNKRAAVHLDSAPGRGDIWILDLERGSTTRFTLSGMEHNLSPVWSPDGRSIFFSRAGTGTSWRIFVKDSTGVGTEQLLYEHNGVLSPLSASPDGQSLVFRTLTDPTGGTSGDYWVLALSGDRKASPYLEAPFNQTLGQLSPDGRWFAYTSFETGRPEVFVQSLPPSGTKYAVSTTGGRDPRWRRDGRELFYLTGASGLGAAALMSVAIEPSGAGLRFGTSQRLFDFDSFAMQAAHTPLYFPYAVMSDGQRFLVARQLSTGDAAPGETPLTVILNWRSLLNRQ